LLMYGNWEWKREGMRMSIWEDNGNAWEQMFGWLENWIETF